MHRIPHRELALAFAFAVLSIGAVFAHGFEVGALKIGHPWSRVTPNGAQVAGGYLSVTNTGSEPDRLTGGTFARAGKVEIHSMTVENGTMTMRQVDGGLEIPAGEKVTLAPGGYHLMFVGLREPLVEKEKIKGTLTFEKAGTVEVEFAVEPMGYGKDQGGSAPKVEHKH